MGARFRRRRTSRGEAGKQALGPLGIVRGRSGRGERTYGAAAVGLGFGALLIVTGAFSLLLRRRRRAAREEAILLRVRDLMTSDPVTIEPQASVVDAARRMIQKEKGPLPVVEGDARPVGMVTDRDASLQGWWPRVATRALLRWKTSLRANSSLSDQTKTLMRRPYLWQSTGWTGFWS